MTMSTTQALPETSKRRSTPIQRVIAALSRLSPYLAGRLATALWFRTHHRRETVEEQRVMDQARTEIRKYGGKSVHVYRWGKGAPVLLTHGWNGNAAQMAYLVEALVDQGFQVTAFDAPGHGRSSGRSTDIHEISGFIEQLLDETGSDTAVIAHSFGCMCALNTIAKGAGVSAVVCISPPKDVTTLLLQYQKILDLNSVVVKRLKQRLEQRLGEDMWSQFSIPEWVRSADIPGLIIHDSRDRYVPVSNGKQIHAAWADSKLQITKGLGHMRILQSEEVISSITGFLARP
jgi:pimeloyl-ACP methyl ester carboxylesterase